MTDWLSNNKFFLQILVHNGNFLSLHAELVPKGSYEVLIVTAVFPVVQMLAACIVAVRVSVFLLCQQSLALSAYMLHFLRR